MPTDDESPKRLGPPADEAQPAVEQGGLPELDRDEAGEMATDADALLPDDAIAPTGAESTGEQADVDPDLRARLAPMRTNRRVAVVPIRSADGAWTATSNLFHGTLEARGFEGAAGVAEELERLRPLGRALLTAHALERGRAEFGTGDLLIDVAYVYGTTTPGEHLELPPVGALGLLPTDLVPTLIFHVDRRIQDPHLEEIVTRTRDAGRIAVRVVGPERES